MGRSEEYDTAQLIENLLRPPGEIRRQFQKLDENRFRLTLEEIGTSVEIDRLRRDRSELIGELSVHCSLPGIVTFDGAVSIADFNMSSSRARTDRARLLALRADVAGLDWYGILEEFCQRVLSTVRAGNPATDMRTFPKPKADDTLKIDGIILPREHPSILFGDGGAAKSYTALYIIGQLAKQGLSVAFFDWELSGPDQRERLERLFGDAMPEIMYVHCTRCLVDERERLQRIVRDKKILYAVYDSIGFACDGPPESAEIANAYLRAASQIGIGALHIAHISKAEGGDQKPFGSAFWHNGARSTWFAKCINSDDKTINVGFYHRKSNLSRLHKPTSYEISFTEEETTFKRTEPGDNLELAKALSVPQRMEILLKRGPLPAEVVAEEIEADINTVRRTLRRYKNRFIVLDGGKLALFQQDT